MSQELMVVSIDTDVGPVKLSPTIVRKYLVNGNGNVSDQEVMMFLSLCKFQKLNPFLREAYLIKYGDKQPATIVTGKDAFLKRARKSPDFLGYRAGVICFCSDSGESKYTEGFCPPGCELVGGWAEVSVKNWAFPLRVEVDLNEYLGRKQDGTVTAMWRDKKATMIRKVALVQALREAFPAEFGGMYSEEEMRHVEADNLPRTPIDPEVIDVPAAREPSSQQQKPEDNGQQGQHEPQRRSRRNKFPVDDPELFNGAGEIATCGITPEQILQLRSLSKVNGNRARIQTYMKAIGYEELSFLREDEAVALLRTLNGGANGDAPPESETASVQAPEPSAAENMEKHPGQRDDLVDCPMQGAMVSKNGYCLKSCSQRRSDGFCPILGETPNVEVV